MNLIDAIDEVELKMLGKTCALDVPAKTILDLSEEYRVWELTKMLRHDIYGPPLLARSKNVMEILRLLGYEVKSASSKVRLEPYEGQALIAHLKRQLGGM